MYLNDEGQPVVPDQAAQDKVDLFVNAVTEFIYQHVPSQVQHLLGWQRIHDLLQGAIKEIASRV